MKMGYRRDRFRALALLTIFAVVVLAGVGTGLVFSMSATVDAFGQQAAINGGVIVEAPFVKVIEKKSFQRSGNYYYLLRYEYYDESGIKYYGDWRKPLYDRETAESYLGQKVEIYIDGKGHSICAGDNAGAGWLAALSAGVSIVFVALLLIAIVLYRKIFKAFNILLN
jgi:hypothetical protein